MTAYMVVVAQTKVDFSQEDGAKSSGSFLKKSEELRRKKHMPEPQWLSLGPAKYALFSAP